MMDYIKEYKSSDVAAEWWAKKLSRSVRHDNGDKSRESGLAMALMDLISMGNEPTEEQVKKFHKILRQLIDHELDKCVYDVWLGCDYHPCELLDVAATAANIPETQFPWKTNMRITKKSVSVSDGYGQPFDIIYEEV